MEQEKANKRFEEKFKELVVSNKLTINSMEDIMIEELEKYKKKLELQLEELLNKEINEKKLINKKNKNGKKRE